MFGFYSTLSIFFYVFFELLFSRAKKEFWKLIGFSCYDFFFCVFFCIG